MLQDHRRRIMKLERDALHGQKGIVLACPQPDETFVDISGSIVPDVKEIRKNGGIVLIVDEDDMAL